MKTSKRVIALALAAAMLLSLPLVSSAASNGSNGKGSEKTAEKAVEKAEKEAEKAEKVNGNGNASAILGRLNSVVKARIRELEEDTGALRGTKVSLSIASATKITDFDGNVYTLIECAPTGYLIYHDESGIFTEVCATSHSPYYGKSGTLKYGGLGSYYSIDRYSVCTDLIEQASVEARSTPVLAEESRRVDETLKENKNENVLNYVSGATDVLLTAAPVKAAANTALTAAASKTVTVGKWTVLRDYTFFTSLTDCGYITGGKCGYIAAGILLTYDTAAGIRNTVVTPVQYSVSSSGRYSIKTALPTGLYNIGVGMGYGAGTNAGKIKNVLQTYLTARGISVSHTELYVPFATDTAIANKIDAGRPVIWFGHVNGLGSHALVVYGYKYGGLFAGYDFVGHLGAAGKEEVYFSGILGSMYTYQY